MSGPQTTPNANQSKQDPKGAIAGANQKTDTSRYDLSAVTYFPLNGSVKEISIEQKALVQRLAGKLNPALNKGDSSILETLIELQKEFSKESQPEAAKLVGQMLGHITVTQRGSHSNVDFTGSVTPPWNNKIKISPFFVAQRQLAKSHGLFINPLTKSRGEMPMLLVPLDTTLEFTASTGNKYPVFLHSTKVNSTSYGSCFTGGNAIVNTHTSSLNSLNEAGRVNLVIANELAHAFLEQELGFVFGAAIPGGAVKIDLPSGLLDSKALESLGELNIDNGQQLFETVSDSFSSRVDPLHDTQRLAMVYLQLESWAAAQEELGQVRSQNNYGLSSKIATAVFESEYRSAGKSEVLKQKLNVLKEHHLKFIRLNSEGKSSEAQEVNRSFGVTKARFANEIVHDLGTEGVNSMRNVFAATGESIISTLMKRQNIKIQDEFSLPPIQHSADR